MVSIFGTALQAHVRKLEFDRKPYKPLELASRQEIDSYVGISLVIEISNFERT